MHANSHSRPNRARNTVRNVIRVGAAVAIGAGALFGAKAINDSEKANYAAEQDKAAKVLEPAMDDIGARALAYANAHPDDAHVRSQVDERGNYKVSFIEKSTQTNEAIDVVMGRDASGQPDPSRTYWVHVAHDQPGYSRSRITMVAPEGQVYDGNRGAAEGYEGRAEVGVDLNGPDNPDRRGEKGYVTETASRTGAYDHPAEERAEPVVTEADAHFSALMTSVAQQYRQFRP